VGIEKNRPQPIIGKPSGACPFHRAVFDGNDGQGKAGRAGMLRGFWVLAAIGGLCASLPATGQTAEPPAAGGTTPEASIQQAPGLSAGTGGSDQAIVVTGQRPMTEEAFEQAARDFVQDLGRAGGPVNQIGRWGEPLCPVTQGLSRDFNAFVSRRIRDIAVRVGAPAGACRKSNVLVIFTTRPDTLMTDVRKNHDALLGYHYVGEAKSLAAFQPPMKSWYVTGTVIPPIYAAIDYAYGQGHPGGTGSRIRMPYKSRFLFALVVVDSNSLEGQAIGPVADRVAMLAFTNPAPRNGCSALPSIMDFLDPGCPSGEEREGLTAYDETYLKELYAFNRDELKGYMRDTIRKRITRDMAPVSPTEPALR
jgi:hypothetical protein